MKKLILILSVLLTAYVSNGQTALGGEIKARTNAEAPPSGVIRRNGNSLMIWDSTANANLLKVFNKLDTIKGYSRTTDSAVIETAGYQYNINENLANIFSTQIDGSQISNLYAKDVSTSTNKAITSSTTGGSGTRQVLHTALYNITTGAEINPLTNTELRASAVPISLDSSTQRQYIKINGTVPVTLDSSLTRSAIKVTQLPAINITNTSFAVTNAGTFAVQVDSNSQRQYIKINGTVPVTGTFTSTPGATVIYDSTVTATSMTVTNLSALASSATAGWQSARVSNLSAKASDYKITVRVSMANTAPANDKAIYVYAVPWGSTDGGTTWYSATGGTTTSPSGSEGTYTIVSAAPHNFRLLGVLNYQTADMNPCDNFLLSNAFGNVMPDAWSLVFINFSGAALETNSGANNLVSYSPVYKTQR